MRSSDDEVHAAVNIPLKEPKIEPSLKGKDKSPRKCNSFNNNFFLNLISGTQRGSRSR